MRRLMALMSAGVLVAALAASSVVAAPGSSAGLDVGQWQRSPVTGQFYRQVDDRTWSDAEDYAVSVGGHLVAIADQAEQDWLASVFTSPNLWIGLNDRTEEGIWAWSSGEPVAYTNWTPGEPNDYPQVGGEDAAVMNWEDAGGHLGWNDVPEDFVFAGIVEAERRPGGPATVIQAATPNGFIGDFDMISGDGTVVARVVATFREPSDQRLVPGVVDIFWASGDVRESHAQVVKAYFWDWDPPNDPEGLQRYGRVIGTLCDYVGPQAGSCQPFAMAFVDTVDPAFRNHVGFSVPGSTVCCDGAWYDVGRGAFALNYSGPTPENNLPVGTHDGSVLVETADPELCYANGWAVDPDQPTARLTVRVFADGVEVWRGPADPWREDVLDAGFGDGYSGFWVNLVDLLGLDTAHEIRVEAQDSTTNEWVNLDMTPRTITCLSG